MNKTVFALSRFGTGPQREDYKEIGDNPNNWVKDQLTGTLDTSTTDGLLSTQDIFK